MNNATRAEVSASVGGFPSVYMYVYVDISLVHREKGEYMIVFWLKLICRIEMTDSKNN